MVTKGLSVGVLALLLPASAWAQSDATRAAARDLGADGVEDFQAANYAAASDKLSRAFEILRVPSLGLWSARALVKVGRLVEASERYLAVTRLDALRGDVAVQKQAQADALTEREALLPRIPSVTIELKGGDAETAVTVDGTPLVPVLLGVRQPINPGKHVVEARRGRQLVRKEFTLSEGQKLGVALEMAQAVQTTEEPAAPAPAAEAAQPSATPPPAAQAAPQSGGLPAGFWVGVAVAGAGLATGGITAGLAAAKKGDLDCPPTGCLHSQRGDVDAHNQLLTISTIGFVAAGVGAATAGLFVVLSKSGKPKPQAAQLAPIVGLGMAGIRGAF